MRTRSVLLGATTGVLLSLLSAASASAMPITFAAVLTADQEIPPPTIPPGFDPIGFGMATFDTDTHELDVDLSWEGLTGNPAAGHIHRINSPAGTGPVIIDFGAFPATPTGSISLTLVLNATQIDNLLAGLEEGSLYFNIHTALNRSGEIRGNIEVVPEPGTLLLLATGLAGTLRALRRRSARG